MQRTIMPAILMTALTLGCIIIIMAGFRKVLGRSDWAQPKQQKVFNNTLWIIAAWLVIVGALAYAGFFRNFNFPPRPVLSILVPLIIILFITFSKKGTYLLQLVPPHWLLMMQSFRIAVELLLWMAFTKGLLPEQMTFEGRNFDVLSGILGLVIGYIIMQNKTSWRIWALLYNIIGLGLLLNILVVAVLSMPTPWRYFMNGPANEIVAEFPFIYLPGVLVVIAFSFHIFSLRQIWLNYKKQPALRQAIN